MNLGYNFRDCRLYHVKYRVEIFRSYMTDSYARTEYWETLHEDKIVCTSFSDHLDRAGDMIRAMIVSEHKDPMYRNLEIAAIEPLGRINHFLVT